GPGPGGPPAAPPERTGGSDLILRELATGEELVLGNVSEFSFDKKGRWLALVIDSAGQIGNGVQLRDMKRGALVAIDTAKASYQRLSWTEKGEALSVLKGVEDKGYEGKVYTVLGFTEIGPKPTKTVYDWRTDTNFPKDMGISTSRGATWNDDCTALFFGIAEQKKKEEPKKEEPKKDETKKDETKKDGPAPAAPKADPSAPKPDLVIWHWKDDRLQSMQQVQAAADKQYTYLCEYRVKDKKC